MSVVMQVILHGTCGHATMQPTVEKDRPSPRPVALMKQVSLFPSLVFLLVGKMVEPLLIVPAFGCVMHVRSRMLLAHIMVSRCVGTTTECIDGVQCRSKKPHDDKMKINA